MLIEFKKNEKTFVLSFYIFSAKGVYRSGNVNFKCLEFKRKINAKELNKNRNKFKKFSILLSSLIHRRMSEIVFKEMYVAGVNEVTMLELSKMKVIKVNSLRELLKIMLDDINCRERKPSVLFNVNIKKEDLEVDLNLF